MLEPSKAETYLEELATLQQTKVREAERQNILSKLLRRLVLSVTNDEWMAFRNFYARFRYLLSKMDSSAAEQSNLDAFRRWVKEGDDTKLTENAILQGIILMKSLVGSLSEKNLPGEKMLPLTNGQLVSSSTEPSDPIPSPGYFSNLFPLRNYAKLKTLKILCSSWTEIQQEEGQPYFIVSGYDLEELDRSVTIYIRQDPHYNYLSVRKLLTKDAIWQFQHIRSLATGENEYETTFDSLLTLEPDYLMEATGIGECYSSGGANSDIYFLSRLVEDLPGTSALKGSIVGYYLDELLQKPVKGREEIYLTAQKNNALKAAQFGSIQMEEIKTSIFTEHLPNIETLVRREQAKELWIEPTYFSTEYGLQGRLDLLSKDRINGTRDIIELKSGSPSNPLRSIAWVNHKVQVICYDMLLESTYGGDRKGTNAVFYSRCTSSPYRNLVSDFGEKRWMLEKRNEIVASIYELAAGNYATLLRIKESGIPCLPSFSEGFLGSFQRAYQPGRITTEYYQEMISFLLRELINAKVGNQLREEDEEQPNGFAGLWLDSLKDKENDFRILYDLKVTGKDTTAGTIALTFNPAIDHAFRKGDPVIMYPGDKGEYNALKQHILKGSVESIHLDSLVVSLNNKQTDYSFIDQHGDWAIEEDIFERNYWSAISCLFNVLTATDRKKRLLFGHEQPVSNTTQPYQKAGLTTTQATAIGQALDARDYYLLQGPPGTGKTSTFLVNYVKESLGRTADRIVVLAFTNKAVEKICESFRNPRDGVSIPYLRLGSRHVKDSALFTEQISGDNPDNWRKTLHQHRVFVCTVTTFQNNWLLLRKFIPFSQVVIDEASQLTEAAIAGVLTLFEKYVLIGDHKQLPAVVTQEEKRCRTDSKYLNQLGIENLRVSLFERLFQNAHKKGWTFAYGQLQDHYRMHEDIAGLITHHYSAGLVAVLKEQQNLQPPYSLPPGHFLEALTRRRVLFIESPRESGFKKNMKEALVAATIANTLIAEGVVKPKDIGIITPFRAQIGAIKKYLRKELLEDEQFIIDTVERFQGDERKVIIFSTTIGNARQIGSIQSITSDGTSVTDRKLLVSISRASDQLIILGNALALRGAKEYRDLLAQVERDGGIISPQNIYENKG
ncbi:MAG TPA: ATP-dependent helicase [Puia sp.]|nr:ATP-dependent helicase [Puia sp.]